MTSNGPASWPTAWCSTAATTPSTASTSGSPQHRLRTRYPELFAGHVADQGHSMFGTRAYTASSVRFGVALGRLERAGELVSEYGPATGPGATTSR
ncbi:hypothetical protein ACFQV2_07530 [Actinokineospora soli]|uniref:Uncharacterized protein n=1 Tax=Actinokineospora soli TaxID=1048753 RepID=A0ABW2TIA4_9PSEU